jgi:hypothetical protein
MTEPQPLGRRLPDAVADLARRHGIQPPTTLTNRSHNMPNRDDEPGTYVVDFEPGLYGPFTTRREALEWAYAKVGGDGERGRTYGYVVCAVSAPAAPLDGAA